MSVFEKYQSKRPAEFIRLVGVNYGTFRISTVREADQICVLDRGEIIERGTHEKLIKIGGEYAALYERQLLEDELEATE